MNSLELDLKQGILSWRFAVGVVLQIWILRHNGFDSVLYRMSVPLVCVLPCACGLLDEYKGGYIRYALPRAGRTAYILGKFCSCGLAGGIAEITALLFSGNEEAVGYRGTVFLSAMFWSSAAAVLAVLSESRYLAYGGAFVVYYFLEILYERYWSWLYCLSPYEWMSPCHVWMFGYSGVIVWLCTLILICGLCYYAILERKLTDDAF